MHRLAILALLLASCGVDVRVHARVTVRRYEDVSGTPVASSDTLGLTYFMSKKGNAKHGAAGFNCMVNQVLEHDDLRLVGTIIHELGNVIVWDHGYPPEMAPDWYLWDGDTKGGAKMVPAEAAWFAQFGPYDVDAGDEWLYEPTTAACDFVNESAGVTVFRRD